jgi:hypothetical protein
MTAEQPYSMCAVLGPGLCQRFSVEPCGGYRFFDISELQLRYPLYKAVGR